MSTEIETVNDESGDLDPIDKIERQYADLVPIEGQYHAHLHKLLETIFVSEPDIGSYGELRTKAQRKCRAKGVKDTKNFKLEKAEPFNLLLIMILGLREDTKA